MTSCCALEGMLRRDEPLAMRTTFRIGGPAALFAEPAERDSFAAAYAEALATGRAVYILGGGSNLLISDEGLNGIVLSTRRLASRRPERHGERVFVLAGTSLVALVNWSAANELAGLEGLVGIPGTVGGALRMNAGGRHGCIGERVARLWLADRAGRICEKVAAEMAWGYRSGEIADPVLGVEFQLRREPGTAVLRRRTEILQAKSAAQPMRSHSAGCFFKNPDGDSAGRLIEMAGLKGCRIGDACVSPKHANFIVNLGRARATDVLRLAGAVRERVRDLYGIVLESEVHCWPQISL